MAGNIKATINRLGDPPDLGLKTHFVYSQHAFADFEINVFKDEQLDDENTWIPQGVSKGLFFQTIDQAELSKPGIIDEETWEQLKQAPSCFLTGNNTVMPKMIFPTERMCNNGLDEDGYKVTSSEFGTAFNWSFSSGGSPSSVLIDDLPTNPLNGYPPISYYGKRSYTDPKYGVVSSVPLLMTPNETSNNRYLTRKFNLTGSESISDDSKYNPLIGRKVGGAAFALSFKINNNNSAITLNNKTSDPKLSPKFITEFGDINASVTDKGEIVLVLNNQKYTFSLIPSTGGLIPGSTTPTDHTKHYLMVFYPVWNGLVISSGVQDSKNVSDSGFYAQYNNDVTLTSMFNPPTESWTEGDTTQITVFNNQTGKKQTLSDWAEEISVSYQDCVGEHAFTPALFAPVCEFSVYFKEKGEDQINKYSFKATPIYSDNFSSYKLKIKNDGVASLVGEVDSSGMQMYRYDFEIKITGDDIIWQRRAGECWGYSQKKTIEEKEKPVLTANGTFNMEFGTGAVAYSTWGDYIQSISISIGMTGTSGSITLDKYAMMQQNAQVTQSIGGIKISISGGNTIVLKSGLVFSGIAMEIGDNVSSGSDTLTTTLYGLEKKLSDIKLINIPFWDGDKVSVVANFLSEYSGIEISFTYGDGDAPLPRSENVEAPAVNFAMGTSAFDAFNSIAEYTNHRFVIQSDGIGYFYSQNAYGLPNQCYEGTLHTYTGNVAISFNGSPNFANLHNTFYTVGIIVENDGGRNMPKTDSLLPSIKFDRKLSTPNIPWSKVFMKGEQGFLTQKKLEELHIRNQRIGLNYMQTGNVTIPGNADILIFDRIAIDGEIYYVHAVNHNIDLQSKSWTTSLSLGVAI